MKNELNQKIITLELQLNALRHLINEKDIDNATDVSWLNIASNDIDKVISTFNSAIKDLKNHSDLNLEIIKQQLEGIFKEYGLNVYDFKFYSSPDTIIIKGNDNSTIELIFVDGRREIWANIFFDRNMIREILNLMKKGIIKW